jgi:hypothetical protein
VLQAWSVAGWDLHCLSLSHAVHQGQNLLSSLPPEP